MHAAPHERLGRVAPLVLVSAILLQYVPTLDAGWLEYDDDWLIRDNPYLARPDLAGLTAIGTDLSRTTRLALGAEYLPVRDTSEWIVAALVGVDPLAHRIVDRALYVAACLVLRAWLRGALPERRWVAELAVALFALHPVHAESVAWMAGRKDVLSLLFVAIALRAYASADPQRRRALVPAACALAALSKASSVVAPLGAPSGSIVQEVPERSFADPAAIAAWSLVLALIVLATLA